MKKTFVNKEKLEEIAQQFPTPFHLYDEKGIRENVKELYDAFSWNKGYKEFFAVKATPNPFLINILHEYGCGTDRIIDALNAASISLIKPTKNVEIYGTEGFDQTTCDIMEVAGLKVPEIYESSGSMRKKLRILCAMKDLFAHSTTVE